MFTNFPPGSLGFKSIWVWIYEAGPLKPSSGTRHNADFVVPEERTQMGMWIVVVPGRLCTIYIRARAGTHQILVIFSTTISAVLVSSCIQPDCFVTDVLVFSGALAVPLSARGTSQCKSLCSAAGLHMSTGFFYRSRRGEAS